MSVPMCPRCGKKLITAKNAYNQTTFRCSSDDCDYRFRPIENTPDPRRVPGRRPNPLTNRSKLAEGSST